MRTTLVSTSELAEHGGDWRVFDCRHELADPEKGERLYRQGHIPGALHAHLDRALSGQATGKNGRHPLPDPAIFAQWLAKEGLKNTDQVVAYDDTSGAFAARLWWMLRWMGHEAVAVLDGGFAKWEQEGRPVETEVPSFTSGSFHGIADDRMRVDADRVLRNLGRSGEAAALQVMDARTASRFAGEGETLDPVGGHIPGALNRPYMLNLGSQGTFKSGEELRAEFAALLGGTAAASVICQCGSGVTACHNLLAMEIAGLRGARLYPGSWSEWCSDPERPVSRGERP